MKNILILFTLIILSITSLKLRAQTFQFEFTPAIGNVELSVGSFSVDGDIIGAGVLYHFRPVDTASGPWSEAAYINKAASVGASYQQLSIEGLDTDDDADIDTLGLTARLITQQNTIFELAATEEDLDDSTTVELSIGKYLDDQSTLSGFVRRLVIETNDDGAESDSELLAIGISGRNLIKAALSDTYIALEGRLYYATAEVTVSDDFFGTEEFDSDGFGVNAGLSYYTSPQLGLGIQFSNVDIENSETAAFGLSAEYFFTETIAVRAEYSQVDIEQLDIDTWLATLITRF